MDTEYSIEGLMLPAALTALSFAIIYYHIKVFTFWSSRGVKGPIPVPFLGTNIYYILRDRLKVDQEWRDKFGHTYGIYEGYLPTLRTTDNELIKFVWIKKFSSFTDRNSRDIHGDMSKLWLLFSKGNHWSNQRTLMTPMFTSSKIKTMFNSMSVCVNRFMHELRSRLQTENDNIKFDEATKEKAFKTAPLFSKDDLMALTLDVISQSFFSIKLDTYKDKTSDFFKRAYAFATFDVTYFLFWIMIPLPIKKYFKLDLIRYSKYEYFDKLSQSQICERREDASKRRNDFIQMLLDAKLPEKYEKVYTEEDDIESHYNDNIDHKQLEHINERQAEKVTFRKFDDREIRAQMTFFFLAGFETTSTSLSFCFYELAHQQVAQEELYEELKSLPSLVIEMDYSNLLSLKKLDAFISESLRLYTPLTEHNRMVTTKEDVVLPTNPPIKLPQKSVVSIPAFVIQRDQDYWQNSLKFDMTRFYPENRYKIKTCSYMPFGVGPRNCIGMRFALLEIKLCLANILLKYKVIPGPKSQKYPPTFNRHAFFLQLTNTDFRLIPRHQ